MFLVPIPQGESFTTLLDFLKSWIKGLFGGSLSYIIVVILIVSAIMSTYDYFAKPEWIRKNHYLTRAFTTTPLYLISKIIGAVFAVMVVFKIGLEVIISADTGATIVDLCGTLFCIVVAFSFIMPFLTDCGIMEFLGVIAKPVVRPLFHVPGRASVDLIASWFGASNAAVILTREQYMRGFYTKREAGYIMTNFSLVSIPFCLMVADTMGIANIFPPFYLCICVVGIILALIIATYTPFFKWISYPMGMYLKVLGVPEAFAAAPATLVGFTDMFIPALLAVTLTSVKTKFVIGVLSLVQIIYLTEVGTIIIKSEIPLNFWKLLVIFLERTIIAIPLIVLFANMIGL